MFLRVPVLLLVVLGVAVVATRARGRPDGAVRPQLGPVPSGGAGHVRVALALARREGTPWKPAALRRSISWTERDGMDPPDNSARV